MPRADDDLNRRVWQLFEAAGFQTKPSSTDAAEEQVPLPGRRPRTVDLSASDTSLGVKIIGENTVSRELRGSFSTRVHDMARLMSPAVAGAGLLVFTKYEVQPSDRDFARENRIQVWEEQELRYYERLVEAIGEHARYGTTVAASSR